MKIRSLALALAFALLPAFAVAQGMKMGEGDADQALMKAMQDMQQGMQTDMTGDADKDFVAMMIPHHQGAIDMAKAELQYGKDASLRKLATAIIKAQEKEIAGMKRWQAKHAK
ncbi:MAG: DUF305 domain-containing protein [Hyphomicrobiales bacterium]